MSLLVEAIVVIGALVAGWAIGEIAERVSDRAGRRVERHLGGDRR